MGGIVYVFAIAFTQVMENTDPGDKYFKTVGDAMQSLLLIGTMPDQHDTAMELGEANIMFRFLLLLYILIASWVVMNMLVGILCEVVSVVSSVEKEELLINYVKGALKDMMEKCGVDVDGDNHISKEEFALLLSKRDAIIALKEVGVDVVGLVDFTDFIFGKENSLSFPDFMEQIMQLRGTNTATVKDVVDLRKLLKERITRLDMKIDESMAMLTRPKLNTKKTVKLVNSP